jgi:eukaryotic-like serine/threonine-protein kinase
VTLANSVYVGPYSAFSVAATGLLAYRSGARGSRQLTWIDRAGTARGTIGDKDATYMGPRISPDGRRVVVSRTEHGNQDLWVLDGSRMTRVTTDAAVEDFPVWSPDGTRIVFRSTQAGVGDLYEKPASGAGEAKRLLASDQLLVPTSWSADARFILYLRVDPLTNADLYTLPMFGNPVPASFVKTPFRETGGAFSPDGRWAAYNSNESGRPEVYLQRFIPPDAGAVADSVESGRQVSAMGGIHPAWRPDGRELYFINPAGEMMAATITVSGSALEIGTPKVLFQSHIFRGGLDASQGRQYDVAPDGRFLINTELDAGAAAPITLLQNWNPDAKK